MREPVDGELTTGKAGGGVLLSALRRVDLPHARRFAEIARWRGAREAWVALALCAAVLAVYAPVVAFDFVSYDDPGYVTRNAVVLEGLSVDGLTWAFSVKSSVNWHPVTWLSHMLDVELFGVNPAGHHGVSAFLHLLNTLLVFALFRSLTRNVVSSAFVAALFGLHPLHVESVAWIAERKDVLSAFFGLLSLLAWVRYTRREGAGRYLLCALLLALGLMAKPMLVTLPFVFALLDIWPLERRRPRGFLVAEKLPLLALSLVAGVLTWVAQAGAGAMTAGGEIPPALRLANALVAYAVYLGSLLWPAGLAVHYPHPYLVQAGGSPLPIWQIGCALALLVTLSGLALHQRSQRPYLLVGWLWFLGMLVPVIGLVQVGTQALADRYTYLPALGVFLIAVWGGSEIARGLSERLGQTRPLRVITAATALAVVIGFASASVAQLEHWRDSRALFSRALEVSPDDVAVRLGLGTALAEAGEHEQAIRHFRRALEIAPEEPDLHTNVANALRSRGRLEEAIVHYDRVVALRPERVAAHINLANAVLAAGRHPEAIAGYERALALEPDSAQAHYNLGNALLAERALSDAARHYRLALRTDPKLVQAHYNLANVLAGRGELEAARHELRQALAIRPSYRKAELSLHRIGGG